MRKSIILFMSIATIMLNCSAFAKENELLVTFLNECIEFNSSPIIENDRTLVQLRPIAEKMGLEIEFEAVTSFVILSDGQTEVRFCINSDKVLVNDQEHSMGVKMAMKDNNTFVPVRSLVEPFGYEIGYDDVNKIISIQKPQPKKEDNSIEKSDENVDFPKEIRTGSGQYSSAFYYQSQEELGFENRGKGYCWVCSYAMLISNATGEKVTPVDVAKINEAGGYKGSFMSGHQSIVSMFGLKLVPAFSEKSIYFGGFNEQNRGETKINATTDEEVANAIREALDNFESGIIVRYEGYPHSMMAVDYDDENIYFNYPGLPNGEHITFSNTCLKNFKLSDISYIQAVSKK